MARAASSPVSSRLSWIEARAVLRTMLAEAAGAVHVIAEDLGLIPPWVRTTMAELGIPGYRVIPWEKDVPQGLRDPRNFPAAQCSVVEHP